MTGTIAFQGELGAYGHQACVEARPQHTPLPCDTFDATLADAATRRLMERFLELGGQTPEGERRLGELVAVLGRP